MGECCEKALEAAADRLGLAMQNAAAGEKVVLKAVYSKINQFVEMQAAKGEEDIDVSAAFAMAIIGNPQVNDEAVIKAAVDYIDQDLEFCRNRNK